MPDWLSVEVSLEECPERRTKEINVHKMILSLRVWSRNNFFITIRSHNRQRTKRIGCAADKLLWIRFRLPGGLHIILRYPRDITTISRCLLRRWLRLRETAARINYSCVCVPFVWLTQHAALSQGCHSRVGDLHPPTAQIGSSLARNPKTGKAINAVKCSWALLC